MTFKGAMFIAELSSIVSVKYGVLIFLELENDNCTKTSSYVVDVL